MPWRVNVTLTLGAASDLSASRLKHALVRGRGAFDGPDDGGRANRGGVPRDRPSFPHEAAFQAWRRLDEMSVEAVIA
jgi:hypothetical protein